MTIDGIIELLKDTTAVSEIQGARVYDTVLPRGYSLPATAVHKYNGSTAYDFQGPIESGEDNVQLDLYARSTEELNRLVAAVKALLNPFKGSLPDGTVVTACYLERDMAFPYVPNADPTAITYRWVLGYRVCVKQ